MSAILVPEFYQTKSVGVVVPSIEIKLKGPQSSLPFCSGEVTSC